MGQNIIETWISQDDIDTEQPFRSTHKTIVGFSRW